jgi:hypothetical protein
MYITDSDFRTRITDQKLALLIQSDSSILEDSDRIATDTIKGYLGAIYDLSAEFAKKGTARNYLIVNWAVNIALYIIYQRRPDADVPQKVIKNHDDTISELADISKGKASVNITRLTSSEGTVIAKRRIGSAKPRSHNL